jgi:hypothetical protein
MGFLPNPSDEDRRKSEDPILHKPVFGSGRPKWR